MNVLMISIGDDILDNPLGNSLERQKRYASALGFIDMIVYSKKSKNLCAAHYENISIHPSKSANMLTFVYDTIKIAKALIKQKKIDVITTQDPFGTALAGYFLKKQFNIPLHVQNHSSFLDNKLWIDEKPFLFSIFNKIAHFTLKKADRLRVVNKKEKQKYIDILNIDESIIDVAPVSVSIEFWQEKPSADEINKFVSTYNIDITKSILSWAGRFVAVKNLPYLFKSVSKIQKQKEISFLIAGDIKSSFWNLETLEDEFNIKPIYLGLLSHEELRIMYYISDIYLHTSNYEGFGLVVSDAQACGCAVVSRDTAGTSDIIENEKSGYLVNGNEEEFSEVVVELLNNKEKLDEMSKYSQEMIKNKFDEIKMFEHIIHSIKSAIDDK